jgi:hypothetical protein
VTLPPSASPGNAEVVAAQRIALSHPLPLLTQARCALSDVLDSISPPEGPLSPLATGRVVAACYSCGSTGVYLLTGPTPTTCYKCGGLWFQALTAYEDDFTHSESAALALPPFLSHMAGFPLAAVRRTASLLLQWTDEVLSLVQEVGPSMMVSPPMASCGSWLFFFERLSGSPTVVGHPASTCTVLQYDRTHSTGYWSAVAEEFSPLILVESSHCRNCGRPHLADAAVSTVSGAASGPLLRLPELFCTHQSGSPPQLTKTAASLSFGSFGGVLLHGAVPTSLLRWAPVCTPRGPLPNLAVPAWVAELPSPWPSLPTPRQQSARALSLNLGGAASKKDALADMLHALEPHVVALQETWQPQDAVSQFPGGYTHVVGSHVGPGTGHVVSLRWDLVSDDSPPVIRHDGREWLAVTWLSPLLGSCFVASVHLAPSSTWAQKGKSLRAMAALAATYKPAVTLLMGDFNSASTQGTPVARALGPKGALCGYRAALPPLTPTNFVRVQGRLRSTGIDNVLWQAEAHGAAAHTLPMPGSHLALHLTLRLDAVVVDPSHWRLFQWRRTDPEDLAVLAAALDLVWGLLACMPLGPDAFVAALHAMAVRFVPRPRSVSAVLESLHRPRPPRTEEEVTAWIDAKEAACAATTRALRSEALMAIEVTAFTRQALRLPTAKMGPFRGMRSSGLEPDLGPEAHREEVSRQAAAVVESRHVRVDVDFFRLTRDDGRWEFASAPLFDLPQSVLLGLLRQGLDPTSSIDRKEYCSRKCSTDLLDTENLLAIHLKPGSWAISADNAPRKVLSAGGSGVVLGVQACRRSRAPSVIDVSVQYAIDRDKPDVPRWVLRAFRTVTMTSPLPAYESGSARCRLTDCQEASGAITPDVFAYREGLSTCVPVLVARAAAEFSLELYSTVAIGDHDESDAFFRIVRSDTALLISEDSGEWNFGEWASGFYARQSMAPTTSSGLAPPYASGEGHSQGCAFAADGYQAVGTAINACLPLRHRILLPHEGTPGLPVCRLSFSDDRRFFAPTIGEVAQLARECEHVSQAACRMVNSRKIDFVLVTEHGASLRLVDTEVPTYEQETSLDPPRLLGVPVLHSFSSAPAVAGRLVKMRKVYSRVKDAALAPALQLRAFRAYALSSIDYLMQGVLLGAPELQAAQVLANKAHRASLGAPKWTHLSLLQLPLKRGGAGAPELVSRAALLLAVSYMTVSLGRNVLGRAAVLSLVRGGRPYCEYRALSARLAPFRLRLLPVTTSPEIREAPILTEGTLDALSGLEWCVAATDGSVTGQHLGAALVLWHPSAGVFFTASVGCLALAAHSTDAEWLGRVVLAHLMAHWQGRLLVASDSTGASPSGLTRAPKQGTVLEVLFRATCLSPVLASAVDVWLPAQHDSGAQGALAHLNSEADRLAKAAAARARPYDLPLKSLLTGRVVGVRDGAYCLSPSKSCALVYDELMAERYAAAFPCADPHWSAAEYTSLLLAGTLPPGVARLAFQLRALDLQGNPVGLAGTLCPFCAMSAPDMRHHVWEACPTAHLVLTVLRGTVHKALLDEAPEQLTSPTVSFGVARDADLSRQDELVTHMSYSGQWRVTVPVDHRAYVTASVRAKVTLVSLQVLADPPSVVRAISLLPFGAPLAGARVVRPDVRVLDPLAFPLAAQESLVLALVLRSLTRWVLAVVAEASLPMPLQPWSSAPPEVLVVCLLGSQEYAVETWLSATQDPAIPRLAVLTTPRLSALVCVLLGRALTTTMMGDVVLLTSPGLATGPLASWPWPDDS